MKSNLLVGIMLAIVGSSASAEIYNVSLTRRDANFYNVDGTDIYIRTKYCYEYVYGQKAVVDTDNRQVIFLDSSSNKCDVDMILQKIK